MIATHDMTMLSLRTFFLFSLKKYVKIMLQINTNLTDLSSPKKIKWEPPKQ